MTQEQKEELNLLIDRGIFSIKHSKNTNYRGLDSLIEAKKIIDSIELEPSAKEKLEFYLSYNLKYNGHNTSKFRGIKFDGEIDINRNLFIDAGKNVQQAIAERITKINLIEK